MPRLLFSSPEFAGQSAELTDGTLSLGRTAGNHLVVLDGTVSARHCELVVLGQEVSVRECGSRNGTFVNGVRVEGQHTLGHGASVRFGRIEAILEVGGGRTREPTGSSADQAHQQARQNLPSAAAGRGAYPQMFVPRRTAQHGSLTLAPPGRMVLEVENRPLARPGRRARAATHAKPGVFRRFLGRLFLLACLAHTQVEPAGEVSRPDWPMFGGGPTRNAIRATTNPPTRWGLERVGEDLRPGFNINWLARTGHGFAMASPVIANGYVWVGTNNESPRDPEQKQPASVLMCFRESDGAFVWQYVVPVREGTRYDTYFTGIKCSPLIEGNRLWFTTQTAEVICLDIGPLLRGDGTPSVLWELDLAEELGVFVHPRVMGWTGANSVAGLDRWIFVNTDNGVDMSHTEVPLPFSPSLVCLDKETGQVVWEDASPGKRIFHVQWSSPLALTLDGQPRVFAGFGDGWLRAFAAATGEKLWELDCNPPEYRTKRYPHHEGPSEILASPVSYAGRIYVAIGQEPEHGEGRGNLVCVDARTGALVWQNQTIHRSISSVVATDHHVYACDFSGFVYGLDATTGQIEWRLDAGCHIWASPLVVGSRLYLGDDDAEAMVIDLERVAARTRTATRPVLLKKGDLAREGIGPGPDDADERPLGWVNSMASPAPLNAAPAFANGVLYWNIGGYLCAIADSVDVAALTALSPRPPRLDAAFVPTPQDVVHRMLELAEVTERDLVVDLGSGDGRVVITAAREHGSRVVGYELDAILVQRSRRTVEEQGLDQLVRIEERDLFTADLSQADVVVVFLPESLLQRLGPQLAQLKPGARVLSHEFLIPGLPPDKTVRLKSTEDQAEHTIHLWQTRPKP